jgi:cyclase
MQRREFIAGVLATGSAAAAAPLVAAQRSSLEITSLGEGLTVISGGGGNVTVFDSPEGVLLVDGGSPQHSAAILALVRQLTGKSRIHTLFNTHWHWDQTGSNAALGKAGTRILAHENTRLWLNTDVDSKWEQRVYPRLPRHALPNQTFYTTGSLQFGGERIDYGLLPQAHTDGDIYVYLRNANVLVAADVVSVGRYPVIDFCTTGWIGGLGNATKALLDLTNESTRFVPGVGRIASRAEVQAENEMLTTMRQRLSKLLAQGMSIDDMLAAKPTADYDAKWGDARQFIANAWPGLVHRARELGASIV